VAWLPLLEKEVHSLPHDTLHPSFRLFLTTEAHPRFPATLLEGALKVSGVDWTVMCGVSAILQLAACWCSKHRAATILLGAVLDI
jgi:hypothetical protein